MKTRHLLLPLVLLLAIAPSGVAAQSVIDGNWMLVLESPQGQNEIPIAITQDGDQLSADLSVEVPPGEPGFTMTGALDGSTVTWSTEVDFQGMPMAINLRGEVSGDEMSGTADYGGMAQGTWSAEREGE